MKFSDQNHILDSQVQPLLQDENQPPNVIPPQPLKPEAPALPEDQDYRAEI